MISYNPAAPCFQRLAASRPCLLALCACLLLTQAAKAQNKTLADSLAHIAASIDGTLGIAVLNGDDHSTYILHQVDQRKLTLAAVTPVQKTDWNMHSPMLAKYATYKEQNFHIGMDELLDSMIMEGDNAACDILLRVIGGPSVVNDYIHSLGIGEINIAWTETEMAADPIPPPPSSFG